MIPLHEASLQSKSAIQTNSLPSFPTQATKHVSDLTKKGRESVGGAVAMPQLFVCGRPDHRSVLRVGLFMLTFTVVVVV